MAVGEGLSRALLVPVGSRWAELQAGWEKAAGTYVRGEVGWHPRPPVSVYGFGQVAKRQTMAGVGLRVAF